MTMYHKGAPHCIDVEAGKKVYICQCGHSKNPPFCDGSHSGHPGTGPLAHECEEASTLYVCGCGKSGNMPWCDGSHSDD